MDCSSELSITAHATTENCRRNIGRLCTNLRRRYLCRGHPRSIEPPKIRPDHLSRREADVRLPLGQKVQPSRSTACSLSQRAVGAFGILAEIYRNQNLEWRGHCAATDNKNSAVDRCRAPRTGAPERRSNPRQTPWLAPPLLFLSLCQSRFATPTSRGHRSELIL